MILLDMRTIIFSYTVTNLVCLFVVLLLWLQNRHRFAGMPFWVFSGTLQTVAPFLIVLRGSIPDWASIVLANIMLIAGALAGYMGMERFVGKRSSQIHNYIILAAFAVIHAYFTFVQPNLAARNLNISAGLLIICFQCLWLMIYRVPADVRSLTRGVGIVFGIYCLVNIVRIVEFFTGINGGTDFFQFSPGDALIMISYEMLFILLAYSLVLMVNKYLHIDIEQQEEKFFKVFYSSPHPITLTRLSDGMIIEANEGFVNFTGYDFDEIKGKTKIDLHLWVNEEDRTWITGKLADKGKVQEYELQFRKKSGEILTGLLSAEVITINNEKCILSNIKDITLRKKAEEALQETRNYLESLVNYATTPIIAWDRNLIITKFNKVFEQLTGRNASEVLGREVDIVFPADTRKQYLEYIKKAGTGENWKSVEIEIQHLDGTVYTLLWNSTAIYLPDSRTIIATIAQGQDITERKLAQKEIHRLNAELEQKVARQTTELRDAQLALLNLVDDMNRTSKSVVAANTSLTALNKELEAFSYSVSHDLRAPLRSIDGFSQALLEDYEDKLNARGKDYLMRIRKGTRQMGCLIDDLLKLSRINKSELIRQPLNLSAIVEEIAREQRENTTGKLREVIIQENVFVNGDSHLMRIALTNLIDNAWKFTGKEEHPRIEFGTTVKEGKTAIFLRDNGVGFDMAYVDKLFGVFQRLHRADEFPGTGIGLATVQRIINRHGGEIRAEGEIGKGATFYFTLPE